MFSDTRGLTTEQQLGFAALDERMQMLADIAARAGAAPPVIAGSFFGAVNHVCNFFTYIDFLAPEGPNTPIISTVQVQVPVDSDQGKAEAQRDWMR